LNLFDGADRHQLIVRNQRWSHSYFGREATSRRFIAEIWNIVSGAILGLTRLPVLAEQLIDEGHDELLIELGVFARH